MNGESVKNGAVVAARAGTPALLLFIFWQMVTLNDKLDRALDLLNRLAILASR